MADKMVTLFQVTSDRIHDIELTPGSTVRDLRAILMDGGYDVVEAEVKVNRRAEGDKMIGRVDGYVLQPGDTVEFNTKKLDLPASQKALKEAAARTCTQGCAGCTAAKPQQTQASKAGVNVDGDKVTVADGHITIERTQNGLVITIH